MKNEALWEDILAYSIGGDQHELFLKKLQQETGWRKKYALRAVLEYRRFLYLAAISKTPVTPANTIDTVWHLHLTFSRCYWDNFCATVLNKPLHHEPSPSSEKSKMVDQFQATQALYRQEFETAVPQDIWLNSQPEAPVDNHWLTAAATSIGLIGIVGLATAAEVNNGQAASNDDWVGLVYLLGGVFVVYIFFKVLLSGKKRKGKRKKRGGSGGGSSGGSDCSSDCSSDSSCSSGCSGGGD
ncbi:MAG: hypothetical protein HN790_18380 [Methylococcales bacterium]|jgi:hypothetical protein|nr:hypothetical protein [Methylococcales bacterium]